MPHRLSRTVVFAAALCAAAFAWAAPGEESFKGRPIYSEPATGLQMPPGCVVDPSWRSRVGASDLEVWIAVCGEVPRAWLLRRSIVEMLGAGLARLRYQVIDERLFPAETAGDTLSVQCFARGRDDAGFVVAGAKWHASGKQLMLASAQSALRADTRAGAFAPAEVAAVDCTRFPEREAMLRQLQTAPR